MSDDKISNNESDLKVSKKGKKGRPVGYKESTETRLKQKKSQLEIIANKTPEEKKAMTSKANADYKVILANMTPEEKKEYQTRNKKRPQPPQLQRYYANASKEELAKLYAKRKSIKNMNDLEKSEYRDRCSRIGKLAHKKVECMNPENALDNMSSIEKKFYDKFIKHSELEIYDLKYQVYQEHYTKHLWDFGIYKHDKLVMLVDIDGTYYHGNFSDYTGDRSLEYRDAERPYSVDSMSTLIMAIPENRLEYGFKEMITLLSFENYAAATNYIYEQICKIDLENLVPILPNMLPKKRNDYLYRNHILNPHWRYRKSLFDLCKFRPEQAPRGLCTQSRHGDWLMRGFHKSINWDYENLDTSIDYIIHNKASIKRLVECHILYDYISPHKVIQPLYSCIWKRSWGNRLAPKPLLSAGRAKLIMHKYAKEYDSIFNPFHGNSAIMLAALSLGKYYYGVDKSYTKIQEATNLLEFIAECLITVPEHLRNLDYDLPVPDRDDNTRRNQPEIWKERIKEENSKLNKRAKRLKEKIEEYHDKYGLIPKYVYDSIISETYKDLSDDEVLNKLNLLMSEKELLDKQLNNIENSVKYNPNKPSAEYNRIYQLIRDKSVEAESIYTHIYDRYYTLMSRISSNETVYEHFDEWWEYTVKYGYIRGEYTFKTPFIKFDKYEREAIRRDNLSTFKDISRYVKLDEYDIEFISGINTNTNDCLMTRVPYADKRCDGKLVLTSKQEYVLSADEWIDICLNNFQCKRYIFIVDKTNQYTDYIKEILINEEYNSYNEYLIVIDRG